MFATLTLVASMCALSVAPQALPSDPFQRSATKALRGDYGELPAWKETAYRQGLRRGLTVLKDNRAKVTSYGPWEPCGEYTASGEPASTDFVSVPPKHIPLGAIIWTPWGLRYAMDTGGAVKARAPYIRAEENMNLDYYTLTGRATQRSVPWLVVKHKTDWNWYGCRSWGEYSKLGHCPAQHLPQKRSSRHASP